MNTFLTEQRPPEKHLVDRLREEALRLGFSRIGIAPAISPVRHDTFRKWLDQGYAGVMHQWLTRHEPLRADPASLLANCQSIISLATDYASTDPLPPAPGQGRVSRYAWSEDYHDLLRSRLMAMERWLHTAAPGCHTRGVVDSAPLAERDHAWMAGLGWIGKNTMLIDPDAGSWFFLSSLLTDLVLPFDSPLKVDHCGTCTACLDACPTGALPAPRLLDANRCISSLSIEDHGVVDESLRAGFGQWIFGCDICQDVCPWNRHAPTNPIAEFLPNPGMNPVELESILSLNAADFRLRFSDTPLARAKRRGLLRSAAIALGNAPVESLAPLLINLLADAEPVIRGAAAWALGRFLVADIGRGIATAALVSHQKTESDPAVQTELLSALKPY